MTRTARAPLQPGQTVPLSWAAVGELRRVRAAPVPRDALLPAMADRFQRERLVEGVNLPSPYGIHQGRPIPHLQLTDAGRALLTRLMP